MHTNNIFGTGMSFSDFTDKETGSIGGENGIRFGNSFNFFDDLKIRVGFGPFLGQGLEQGLELTRCFKSRTSGTASIMISELAIFE